jgi:hypothetical protein
MVEAEVVEFPNARPGGGGRGIVVARARASGVIVVALTEGTVAVTPAAHSIATMVATALGLPIKPGRWQAQVQVMSLLWISATVMTTVQTKATTKTAYFTVAAAPS